MINYSYYFKGMGIVINMLNGPAVAFPAVFSGSAAGVVVWFLTTSLVVSGVVGVIVGVAVGRYCYRQLK